MTTISGYAKILVTIQRDGKSDDLLIVTPDLESDGYYVTFKQKTIGNTVDRYFENAALLPYISSFFTGLLYDHQRPDFVQIDVPMYPTVLLTPEKLFAYDAVLNHQVESLQDDWPFESFKQTV